MQDVIETTEKELNSDIEQQQIIQEETQKKIDNFTAQNDDANADVATQTVTSLSGIFTNNATNNTGETTPTSTQNEKGSTQIVNEADPNNENNYHKGCE